MTQINAASCIIGGILTVGLGFTVIGKSNDVVRVIPPNAEATIARTGVIPFQVQKNTGGKIFGSAIVVIGLLAAGYGLSIFPFDEDENGYHSNLRQSPGQLRSPSLVEEFEFGGDPFAGIKPVNKSGSSKSIPEATVKPATISPADEIVDFDLAGAMVEMEQFCHLLLTGENGTGKTTFAMYLLYLVLSNFINSPEFDCLLIDPKFGKWGGLHKIKRVYQSAFRSEPENLEASVERLEEFYSRLKERAIKRQRQGVLAKAPLLVIIDEVNNFLASLKAYDEMVINENRSLPAAQKLPSFLNLYNRAKNCIVGIGRDGREDKIWIWLIGQNPNLNSIGFDGASDRANFSVVAVGCRKNQMVIDLALSNKSMFPHGNKLRSLLEYHQGEDYQIAAHSRFPKNLYRVPTNYCDIAGQDLPKEFLDKLSKTPINHVNHATDSIPSFSDAWADAIS